MPSNSTYPKVLDTDTNLYRVSSNTALIPDHHNNHTDALEMLEATVGDTGDGSEGGGGVDFQTGLAHWTGLASVATPNPWHPWLPHDARSWYPVSRSKPASWTVDASVGVSYVNPIGRLRLLVPTTNNLQVAYTTLPASSPWNVICKFAPGMYSAAHVALALGFSVSGAFSDLDGVRLTYYNGISISMQRYANGALVSSDTYALSGRNAFMWFKLDGALLKLYSSQDGVTWGVPILSTARAVTPTKWGVWTWEAPAAQTPLYIDFIAFGASDPASAAGAA